MTTWYAATAAGADFHSHLLPSGSIIAACGERRYSWQPVEEFARPEAFTHCPDCERALIGVPRKVAG